MKRMRFYCTYFDRNYLYRAIALYESLSRRGDPFELWTLCFDAPTFDLITRLALPGVRPIALETFEAANPDLKAVKATRHPREYYWTSTPLLIDYVLQQLPPGEMVAYLDADLYFFGDPGVLFEELAGGSVLIVEHRYAERHAGQAAVSGVYNVGSVLFRRDEAGLACLRWWRAHCLEWCYAIPEPGRFGDQKYLDEFLVRFTNIVVARHLGIGLAPWNIARFPLSEAGGQLWFKDTPVIFYHFHSLAQIGASVYEPWAGKYTVPRGSARLIYQPYIGALRRAQARVAAVDPGFKIDYTRRGPRSLLAAWFSGRLVISAE